MDEYVTSHAQSSINNTEFEYTFPENDYYVGEGLEKMVALRFEIVDVKMIGLV